MIPPAPPRDPRLRRHSTKTMDLARRMYGDGDAWTPTQIVRYFADQGISVSLNTVRLWVIPGMADEHRRQNMECYFRRRDGHDATPSETPMLDRMLELRGAGLTLTGISHVMRLDHGLKMTSEQVRYYVNERREPHRPKRLAS